MNHILTDTEKERQYTATTNNKPNALLYQLYGGEPQCDRLTKTIHTVTVQQTQSKWTHQFYIVYECILVSDSYCTEHILEIDRNHLTTK